MYHATCTSTEPGALLGFGMMKNHKLAGAIADMGFDEIRGQLEYKCKLYGSKLIVVDRSFPSSKTCSNCGHKTVI